MSRIIWDNTAEKFYETGVDRGVVYPQDATGAYPKGEGWNGLINVTLSPTGAEANPFYANNKKYANIMSVEEMAGSIEAYTFPTSFAACNGLAEMAKGLRIGQQKRSSFGFCFRNLIGNDVEGTALGYKITIVYGALAAPSEQANATVNDSPELKTMSWEFTTTPVEVEGFEPTASLEIDSREVDAAKLKELEDILYGSADEEPRLPLPAEIAQILGAAA